MNGNNRAIQRPSQNRDPEFPLRVLKTKKLNFNNEGNEQENSQKLHQVLDEAIAGEQACQSIYNELNDRTQQLASQTITISFQWRLRVGGILGFYEILLPAFHPLYGVPYIPASSIKGVVRAWAEKHHPQAAQRLFGTLDDGVGCVQFLDAFPKKPCLSKDVVTPQWQWNGDQPIYQPSPHVNLSLKNPQICFGLLATQRGSQEDVETVARWLPLALQDGMGSRTSSGYGRPASGADAADAPLLEKISFELWTGGIYGADTSEPELRPTAFRGVLRYWFRAIALAMYPPQQAKKLESKLFGAIEPEPTKGSLALWLENIEEEIVHNSPPLYVFTGQICLQASQAEELNFAKNLLQLASHLGGVGRGSRRPLHWNDAPTNNGWRGWRGCYWELLEIPKLRRIQNEWQNLLQQIRDYLLTIEKPEDQPANLSPGLPDHRRQEVFNQGTHIFFIPCPDLPHPGNIDDWQNPQNQQEIRGEALNLLYDPQFKGVSNNSGNPHVGGQLGTPSYVTIQSNFAADNSYQTVIVFGFPESRDRKKFCKTLTQENQGFRRIKPHEILQNSPSQNA